MLVGIGIGAFMLYRHWSASHADLGQIIRAPDTPYKVKPVNPGGLKVDPTGAVAEHTGTGNDIDAPIDLSALPEKPVTGPGSEAGSAAPIQPRVVPAPPAPAPGKAPPPVVASATPPAPVVVKPAPLPARPTPVDDKPVSLSGGGTIQLGALNSEAKAKQVWKEMSGRFPALAPLTMSITPVKVGDNTLYRLRASGGDARTVCAKLKVAGEVCAVVSQ
ncbi:SPOR domain-containing protein [Sphingomonas sp. MMS24-J13]|uniref:SPOR domain-containing protein n=1 Tax=Sphingomonas sp. MMS24-J13 TaxID=3238686 RepID=UPI00384BEF70